MVLKKRKTRKFRGTRTCGRGKKGSRKRDSGRGYAGSHKHKWTWILKYEPEHFGFHGQKPIRKRLKAINIRYLNELAIKKNLNEIDVSALGYEKVLGGGMIDRPLIVKAKAFTQSAKKKIESAGGKARMI